MQYVKDRGLWMRRDGSVIGGIVHLTAEQKAALRPSVRSKMLAQPHLGSGPAADGLFYWDTREPFIGADITAVTLATTMKALYPVSNFPVLGGQYFTRIGKRVRIEMFGRITTVLTPGNGNFQLLWGNGTDANGTNIVTGTAFALLASQTNLSWKAVFDIHCRATGSAGTLFAVGLATFNVAVVASTVQPILVPQSAPAVSGSLDLTAALIPSVQFSRSGSTVETMQVHDLTVTALN